MTDGEREKLLASWTKPPSDSEDERAENAYRIISNALRASATLAKHKFRIFIQGSYRNSTNVRFDSDVDICVCLTETFVPDYTFAANLNDSVLRYEPATYPASQFKTDVHAALIAAFGKANAVRGNKAIKVRENSNRLKADVVACLEYRRHNAVDLTFLPGTCLYPDRGGMVVNHPHQHYENGVAKNKSTGFFKQAVRVMKNLRNHLDDKGIPEAKPIASFLSECLVWNTPDHVLAAATWNATVRQMLVHLWDHLQSEDKCGEWGQVSELLYLFKGPNSFSREQAKDWILAAWKWLEFK